MRLTRFAAALAATAAFCQPLLAQGTMSIPVAGSASKTGDATRAADPADSPEEIAKDAARDLKDSRFYNKPGATRAQYDADWQECRLIARGSRTPGGTVPVYTYGVSPLAAGVGGAIGGLIAGAIAEGQQRRANRRSCLLIKGWRLVEPPAAQTARVAKMSDAERDAYFDTIVGAKAVQGQVTERTSFALAPDPAVKLDAPVSGPASVFLGKKIDPAAPFELAPGEGAVVIAYRRPDAASIGRHGTLSLARYDVNAGDIASQPRDWKKKGDTTTYWAQATSDDKKAPLEVQVLRLTAGEYVIASANLGKVPVGTSFCFGAPAFRVAAGEVVYVGDFLPLQTELSTGDKFIGLAYASHIEDSRAALAAKQPKLAAALNPAPLRNHATFGCSAITMDRWDLPGVSEAYEGEPAPFAAAPEQEAKPSA
ncbi:MAG TPA: hypothetical protein VF727_16885 [Allosphingosinicella sp.]|jgi:hypothetical protein